MSARVALSLFLEPILCADGDGEVHIEVRTVHSGRVRAGVVGHHCVRGDAKYPVCRAVQVKMTAGDGCRGNPALNLAGYDAPGDIKMIGTLDPSAGPTGRSPSERAVIHNNTLFLNLFFENPVLKWWHQKRHANQILGRPRLNSHAGSGYRSLWRQHHLC